MKTLTLVRTDFKNIFRDPSLIMIFVVPFILLIVLRIIPPLYEAYLPVAFEYRPLILAAFSLIISGLSGFLMAFVMLDEKDQQLFQVFRVMPFTFPKLTLLRILTMLVTGFIFNLILIAGAGLIKLNLPQILLLSFMSCLSGPANTLLVVSLAKNKIEGATYFKLLNMFILAPLVGVFIQGPFKFLLGIFPFFWVFISFINYTDTAWFYVYAAIGIIMNFMYLFMSYSLFLKRVNSTG